MKLFRDFWQAAIFIGWTLLSISQGIAQSGNSGKIEVLLPVTALDEKKGVSFEPTKEKIKVFLGKSEQTITSIVPAETPSKIVFLVDYSGSMREAFSDPTKVKAAFMQFFQSSNSANEYALIAFNQDAALIKDWTTKPQDIIDGFDSLTSQKP
jgi:von Willebrand factor type A domain